MKWLERARRELRKDVRSGTANTVKTMVSAVTAVRPQDISPETAVALRDAYEERAAIMEFDGGLSREDAERAASASIYGNHRLHGGTT